MKNKIKKISIIALVMIIGFIMGITMPIVVKGENGDATSAQVLKGKTFTSSLVSVATSGEMKNLSGKTFATNNPGVSTIDVDDGYYTEIQVDASAVYDAGVAAGEQNGVTSNVDDVVLGDVVTQKISDTSVKTVNFQTSPAAVIIRTYSANNHRGDLVVLKMESGKTVKVNHYNKTISTTEECTVTCIDETTFTYQLTTYTSYATQYGIYFEYYPIYLHR